MMMEEAKVDRRLSFDGGGEEERKGNHDERQALEEKMRIMRERFQRLQELEKEQQAEAEELLLTLGEDAVVSSPRVSRTAAGVMAAGQQQLHQQQQQNYNPLHQQQQYLSQNQQQQQQQQQISTAAAKESMAVQRWNKIRMIVRSNKHQRPTSAGGDNGNRVLSGSSHSGKLLHSPRGIVPVRPSAVTRGVKGGGLVGQSNEHEEEDFDDSAKLNFSSSEKSSRPAPLELEDVQLMEEWKDENLVKSFQWDESLLPKMEAPPDVKPIEDQFITDADTIKLEVSRIPEEVVAQRKEAVERVAFAEHKRALENLKQTQVDIIWREQIARKRVQAMEEKVKVKQRQEQEKIIQLALEKERSLAKGFRKAREELEVGIRRQHAAVNEHFGKLLIHEESLARRFHVFYKMFPQPMEFRIHLLRAVKNKLPKGAYAIMLTQYDRLGGYPLVWSNLGANGIGNTRPGITKVVKHQGRFFDRILRFEDSCFALCPPRPLLKPGFIFVLELFQLANFRNPEDQVVAWTALPMSFESMSLVEGKFKLPLLRGEHTAQFQHFRSMESTIANDLDEWLCNIYFEVRQMSLHELGATDEMLKSTNFDLDYFNKVVMSDSQIASMEKAGLVGSKKPLVDGQLASQRSLLAPTGTILANNTTQLPQQQSIDQIPLMGVDKGIFRRKSNHINNNGSSTLSKQSNGGDIENGLLIKEAHPINTESNNDVEDVNKKQEASKHRGGGGGSGQDWWKAFQHMVGVRSATIYPLVGRRTPAAPQSQLSSKDLVLKKDESFVEHRKELMRRWKTNIKSKVPQLSLPVNQPDNGNENGENALQVRERGYNLQDQVFLHKQQRGKLAGIEAIDDFESRQWAAAGLEGRIVRRWQGEGSRFDSDAIEDGTSSPILSPRNTNNNFNNDGNNMNDILEEYQWEELRDVRDMYEYNMAVASDPARRKHIMPGSISSSKLRYLSLELFGDLVPFLFGTFEFYSTIFLYLFALWMRIYVHYLAQYLYLLSSNTPVYDFKMAVLFISYKYMSTAISTSTEVAIVAMGPVANIAVFLFLVMFGHLFYHYSGFLPDIFSKFFAYFGVATVLNPLLVLIIDLIYHHYDCGNHSDICKENYTAKDCHCYNGDFTKLWYRMDRLEGSGLTGLVITAMLYLASGVLSLLILYEYLLNIHRDGRILDLWRRINAPAEEFFIPDDFEVSMEELQYIINHAKNWKGPGKSKRRVYIQEGNENDPFHKNFAQKYRRYIIEEISPDGTTTSVHRQFLLDPEGKILEVFTDFHQDKGREKAFDLLNATFADKAEGSDDENENENENEDENNVMVERRSSSRSSSKSKKEEKGNEDDGTGITDKKKKKKKALNDKKVMKEEEEEEGENGNDSDIEEENFQTADSEKGENNDDRAANGENQMVEVATPRENKKQSSKRWLVNFRGDSRVDPDYNNSDKISDKR